MKNFNFYLVLLCLFLIIPLFSTAQPTITATGLNPVIGETYNIQNCNFINPGNAGANQTWNLSAMIGTSVVSTSYVAPSSTPHGSSFPNSNIAWSIPSSSVSYYNASSSAMQYYGFAAGSLVMSYANPEDVLHYPFTYNNSYSDNWNTVYYNGAYTFYRNGTTNVIADGYGTLITPEGTYNDVLRVHLVQSYQDSAFIGVPYIATYHNDEYRWYKEGTHIQIATVYSLTVVGSGTTSNASYLISNTAINQPTVSANSTLFYPNPASDHICFNIHLTKNEKIEMVLFNTMSLKMGKIFTWNGVKGENALNMDLNNYPEGVYFAKILVNGTLVSTGRFMIIR
jgi:hypothetical protein